MSLATNDQLHSISKVFSFEKKIKKELYSEIALFHELSILNSLIALNNNDRTSYLEQHDGPDYA